jgi:hypothetical protein
MELDGCSWNPPFSRRLQQARRWRYVPISAERSWRLNVSIVLHEHAPLMGRRILVVEDEYFLADDIRRALQSLGAEIAGPSANSRMRFTF